MTQRFLLLFFTLLIKKKSKKVKYNEKFIKKKNLPEERGSHFPKKSLQKHRICLSEKQSETEAFIAGETL